MMRCFNVSLKALVAGGMVGALELAGRTLVTSDVDVGRALMASPLSSPTEDDEDEGVAGSGFMEMA